MRDRRLRFPPAQQVQSDVPSQQAYQPRARQPGAPDIEQAADLRAELERAGGARSSAIWDPRSDPRIPKALWTNRSTQIVAANVAQKVLNQNPIRSTVEFGNNTGAVILVNFGPPAFPGSGIPVANNGQLLREGLACPTNEIFITSAIAGGIVTVYEGIPSQSPTRHRRGQ